MSKEQAEKLLVAHEGRCADRQAMRTTPPPDPWEVELGGGLAW
jgi:hypothetical protein